MDKKKTVWHHPGGKFRRLGPESCSDAELLAILIGSGAKGKAAVAIAEEIIERFGSFRGMAGQPMREFYKIKGLKEVRATRIATAFEIARRIVENLK